MIKGIGIDIVDKERMGKILDRQGQRFIDRILTVREQLLLPTGGRQIEFVAGRFSAKEAFAKATGLGIGKDLSWHDVEISKDEWGKPVIFVDPAWEKKMFSGERVLYHISITHEKRYAAAQVIIES